MKMNLLFVALIAVASAVVVLIGRTRNTDSNVDDASDESMINYLGV